MKMIRIYEPHRKKEKKNEKEHVLARLKEDCLVAVVRAKNYEQGEKVVDAIIEGGINFMS